MFQAASPRYRINFGQKPVQSLQLDFPDPIGWLLQGIVESGHHRIMGARRTLVAESRSNLPESDARQPQLEGLNLPLMGFEPTPTGGRWRPTTFVCFMF